MLRISVHIERLLPVNDCVIVPGLGGFVLQSQPAVYAAEAHAFYPPHREIVFNPALGHNDGLLSESYMRSYGMGFGDAQFLLKKDVEDLKAELEAKGFVSLGAAGSFRKEKEGGYLFQPGAGSSTFVSHVNAYGLDTFHLPPFQATAVPREASASPVQTGRQSRRVFYLPVHRAIVHAVGMAAVVVALFLLMSVPVKEVNQTAYTAGFTLSKIMPEPVMPVEQPAPFVSQSEKAPVMPPAPAVPETATPSQTMPAMQLQPTPAQPQKTCYIIIGSFRTEAQAAQFLTEIPVSACKETGVVKHGVHVRVYAARYVNRKDAETYLSRLRANGKFKNAWLFVGR
ncbi:MAG: SPOR domain-containing protein [Tannerella sp.]|nr:SPOR domain-containing protein [Tannerella sp.]